MAAPVVQDLSTILAQIDPAYAPQRQILNTQIAALPGSEQAQMQGLDTAKSNAFRDINTNANSKGVAFSGVPTAEQYRYVGEKYLPAVAALKGQTQQQQFSLQTALAQLGADARLKAIDLQHGQQSDLNAYNSEVQKEQFQAQQNALDRQAQAAHDAAASAGLTPAQQKVQDVGGVHTFFQSVVGSDGRVSPQSYAQAKALWASMGYNTKEFDQQFASYRNPKNKNYKLG